jgi:phage tail P2-like protein
MSSIYTDDLLRTLPQVLKNDKAFHAYATVMAKQLRSVIDDVDCTTIYARIDSLPEAVLDILAYDFKVDWWDYGYTVEQKRQTLKDSFLVHKHLGTKFAVETAISAIYPETTVEEWFEYDGEPYTFRLVIDATDLSVDSERHKRVLELANYYKNLRSHLDRVKYTIFPAPANAVCASAFIGSYMRMTVNLQIPGEVGPPHIPVPTMAAVCRAGSYARVEAKVALSGDVDRPHSRLPVHAGVATAGTYTKLTMEVAVNGLD